MCNCACIDVCTENTCIQTVRMVQCMSSGRRVSRAGVDQKQHLLCSSGAYRAAEQAHVKTRSLLYHTSLAATSACTLDKPREQKEDLGHNLPPPTTRAGGATCCLCAEIARGPGPAAALPIGMLTTCWGRQPDMHTGCQNGTLAQMEDRDSTWAGAWSTCICSDALWSIDTAKEYDIWSDGCRQSEPL